MYKTYKYIYIYKEFIPKNEMTIPIDWHFFGIGG